MADLSPRGCWGERFSISKVTDRIIHLVDDWTHAEALARTGFWGAHGVRAAFFSHAPADGYCSPVALTTPYNQGPGERLAAPWTAENNRRRPSYARSAKS